MPLNETEIKARFNKIRALALMVKEVEKDPQKALAIELTEVLLDVAEDFFVNINLLAFCANEERNKT